jgi:uncharacterized protein (UPF0332 family)
MKRTPFWASIATKAAGRAAYMAGLHAARRRSSSKPPGASTKTHSGVNGEFSRLVRDDPRVDDPIRAFLGRTYNLKASADYQTGPGSHISAESAREAIDTARRFVAKRGEPHSRDGDTPSAPEAPKP